jgi:hypothetical protein
MKKLLPGSARSFIFVAFLLLSFTGNAQSLANTYWRAYDTTNSAGLYWNFSADSVYYSQNGNTWYVLAKYSTAGSVFKITGDNSGNCVPGDTGTYVMSTSGDTLRFTNLLDTCSERITYFETHYFIDITTGINPGPAVAFTTVSPNPSTSGIFEIRFGDDPVEELRVYDSTGKLLLEKHIAPGTTRETINIEDYLPGVYLLQLKSTSGTQVIKLVK